MFATEHIFHSKYASVANVAAQRRRQNQYAFLDYRLQDWFALQEPLFTDGQHRYSDSESCTFPQENTKFQKIYDKW